MLRARLTPGLLSGLHASAQPDEHKGIEDPELRASQSESAHKIENVQLLSEILEDAPGLHPKRL